MEAPQPTGRSGLATKEHNSYQASHVPESTFGDLSSSFHSLSPPDRWCRPRESIRKLTIPLALHEPMSGQWYDWLAISEFATMTEYMPPCVHPPSMLDQAEPLTGYKPNRESHLENPQ